MNNRVVVYDEKTMSGGVEAIQRRDKALAALTLNDLFHRLWSKSVGTHGYVKAEWSAIEKRLTIMGINWCKKGD